MQSSGTFGATEEAEEVNHAGKQGSSVGMFEDGDALGARVLESNGRQRRRTLDEGQAVAGVRGSGAYVGNRHLKDRKV